MKKYTSKLVILAVFVLLSIMMLQPVYAMGRRPHTGDGTVQGVPEPMTILSLLGVGIAGVGGYLLMRKKKDK
jgi:hypothetical protein